MASRPWARFCGFYPSAIRIRIFMKRSMSSWKTCTIRATRANCSSASRFAVLNDLGFGLDLAECAATGTREDLIYVSPKSGRAVSRTAGAPYAGKMLALPGFLADGGAADYDSLAAAFRMTAFFLHRHVYEPRGLGLSAARDGFVQAALKALKPQGVTLPPSGIPTA